MVIFFFFAVFVIFLSLNLYICIEIKLLRGGEKTAQHREMQITCVQVRLLKKRCYITHFIRKPIHKQRSK